MDLFDQLNSGLESLGLAEDAAQDADYQERLQTLQDRMQSIEETGLVSRAQVQQLVVSGVPLNERRYPMASFTIEPSPVGVTPALEAAGGEQNSILQKMIDAAVAALKKIIEWVKSTYKKIVDFVKSVKGKKSLKAVEDAKISIPALNAMRDNLPAIMRGMTADYTKKGTNRPEVQTAINEIWEKFENSDNYKAQRLLERNIIFGSEMMSDPKFRADIKAAVISIKMILRYMQNGINESSHAMQMLISNNAGLRGNDASQEELDKLISTTKEKIDKYNHHPFTTKLYQDYGYDEIENPTIHDGYKALLAHLHGKPSREHKAEWKVLSTDMIRVIGDLAPSDFVGRFVQARDPSGDLETSIGKFTLNLKGDRASPALADALRHFVQLQADFNSTMVDIYRLEGQLASGIFDIGNTLRARIGAFQNVIWDLEAEYRKLGVDKEFNQLTEKYMSEITSLGYGDAAE